MTRQQLNEGLGYLDMENMVVPVLGIDEYSAHSGDDDEIVTLSFIVRDHEAGEDLSDWLERGYDWVVDASVSEGELKSGQWVVFAELNRRSTVPARVMEVLSDLDTLTDVKAKDWKVSIDGKEYPATEENIANHLTLSPHLYRQDHEEELNEWREIAGLPNVNTYENDEAIKAIKRQAGIE
jgi:hypothetical protein